MVSTDHKVVSFHKGCIPLRDLEDGEHRIWDGKEWTNAYIKKSSGTVVKLHLENDTPFFVSPNQSFLTSTNVLEEAKNLAFKSVIPVSPVLGLDAIREPEHPKLKVLDNYDLGVLYARLLNKEHEGKATIVKFKEKEFDLNKEITDILFKVCEFDKFTEYDVQGNKKVYYIYDEYVKDLKSRPDEVYLSTEFARGYIRAVFDNAQVTSRGLRIFKVKMDFMEHLREILKLLGIQSSIEKNSIYIKNIGDFMLTINTISDTVGLNVYKIWNGYRDPRRKKVFKIWWVQEVKKPVETALIFTDTAFFSLDGVVLTCSD